MMTRFPEEELIPDEVSDGNDKYFAFAQNYAKAAFFPSVASIPDDAIRYSGESRKMMGQMNRKRCKESPRGTTCGPGGLSKLGRVSAGRTDSLSL
jgi:hypothetical protein